MTTITDTEDSIQTFDLPAISETKDHLETIRAFQRTCREHLVEGSDYGTIPGTQRPTLLKPGAEKLVRLLGLAPEYEVESIKDWDRPFFHFQITCRLRHLASGQVVDTGVGECNSMEARYRWRQAKRQCPECGVEAIIKGKEEYGGGWLCFKRQDGCGAKFGDDDQRVVSQQVGRVENDDIYSQVNTILKMAKKRAMVDAALSAGRLSDVFTQDLEDMPRTSAPDQKSGATIDAATGEIVPPASAPPSTGEQPSGPTGAFQEALHVLNEARKQAGMSVDELVAMSTNHYGVGPRDLNAQQLEELTVMVGQSGEETTNAD